MLGIGCDLADVERIEKAITRKGFKERVYTLEEIAYCTGSHGDKAQSYAARFAAKEAFLKAIGTGLRGKGQLTEIYVVNDDLGKPELKVRTESDRLLRIPHRKDGCEKDTPYIKPHRYHCNGGGSA